MNPLEALATNEKHMAASLNAAADALDVVGTYRLEAAVSRLRQSAVNAQTRLMDIKSNAVLQVQHVVDMLADLSQEFAIASVVLDRPQLEVISVSSGEDEIIDLNVNAAEETARQEELAKQEKKRSRKK